MAVLNCVTYALLSSKATKHGAWAARMFQRFWLRAVRQDDKSVGPGLAPDLAVSQERTSHQTAVQRDNSSKWAESLQGDN